MLEKRRILSLLIAALTFFLLFYFYHSYKAQVVQGAGNEVIDLFPGKQDIVADDLLYSTETRPQESGNDEQPGVAENLSSNIRRMEIFGRVIDEYDQPIENVLISEDRYLYNARSDSNGHYRLVLELPKHKFPLVNFMRAGYRSDRIGLSTEGMKIVSEVELNVILIETPNSINIAGWIGNEIGANLADQRIRISSRGAQGLDNIYHTVVSDEKGDFLFEGIKPDIEYMLEVYTTPEYEPYAVKEMLLTHTTPRLDITLKLLKLVQLSGMFVDIEGAPIPDFEVEFINISTRIHVRRIVTDSSGFFNLDNFPIGEIKLSTRAPRYFRITGLTLVENDYRNLIIKVDWGSHQLSGWVTDQSGVPVERAMVTLDAEIMSDGLRSASNRSLVTDNMGYFVFDQLGNTPHKMSIYARGFKKKELLHQFEVPVSEMHIRLDPQ